MNKAGPLILRADASPQIGTGHVMRCLALAQAWQDQGGSAVFVMAQDAPALEVLLEAEGMRVHKAGVSAGSSDDAALTIEVAAKLGAKWIVLDGYQFDDSFQRTIITAGLRLLWMDDNGDASHYFADLVLNQNLHAEAALYESREPHTKLLLGTRYVLLRREFLRWAGWNREIPGTARKLLITLGGADPQNATVQVIRSLRHVEMGDLEVVAVAGSNYAGYPELSEEVERSGLRIRLERNITNMSERMAWADVAVSGGGSTCWELAFMGLPSVLVVLADNQEHIAGSLETRGVSLNLGRPGGLNVKEIAQTLGALLRDEDRRKAMSSSGRRLVDGRGAARVVEEIIFISEAG